MLWGLFVDANPDSSSCSRAFNETGWGIRWGMFRVGLETQRRAPSPADLMAGVVKDQRLTRINLFGGWLTSSVLKLAPETGQRSHAKRLRNVFVQTLLATITLPSPRGMRMTEWWAGWAPPPPSPWWAVSFWQKRCDYGLRCPTRRD